MAILAIVSYGSHAYSVTNSGDRQQALEHTRDNEEKIAGAMARLIEEPDREIPQDWNIFCKERPFNKTMEDQEGITVQVCQFSVLTGGKPGRSKLSGRDGQPRKELAEQPAPERAVSHPGRLPGCCQRHGTGHGETRKAGNHGRRAGHQGRGSDQNRPEIANRWKAAQPRKQRTENGKYHPITGSPDDADSAITGWKIWRVRNGRLLSLSNSTRWRTKRALESKSDRRHEMDMAVMAITAIIGYGAVFLGEIMIGAKPSRLLQANPAVTMLNSITLVLEKDQPAKPA